MRFLKMTLASLSLTALAACMSDAPSGNGGGASATINALGNALTYCAPDKPALATRGLKEQVAPGKAYRVGSPPNYLWTEKLNGPRGTGRCIVAFDTKQSFPEIGYTLAQDSRLKPIAGYIDSQGGNGRLVEYPAGFEVVGTSYAVFFRSKFVGPGGVSKTELFFTQKSAPQVKAQINWAKEVRKMAQKRGWTIIAAQ